VNELKAIKPQGKGLGHFKDDFSNCYAVMLEALKDAGKQ
jgi:hypothetical protein